MPEKKKNAPLVLGILSIVTAPLIAFVGVVLGIIGIVLSATSRNETFNYRLELILSIVGTVIGVANILLALVLFSSYL